MNKAVFIDKDGTLIEDVPYNVDPDRITFISGSMDALKILKSHGYLLMLISNQSGVAHGYFTEESLAILQQRLQQRIRTYGVELDGFFFCPHHPAGAVPAYAVDCECRKPKPGMILAAAERHNIDLAQSWMVGDILNDVEAGNRAGCQTILINNGNETEWVFSEKRLPTAIVSNLLQAAQRIVHEPELV